jgi:hypothetical protein
LRAGKAHLVLSEGHPPEKLSTGWHVQGFYYSS